MTDNSSGNQAELADLLQKAKKDAESGKNVKNRSKQHLTKVKLDRHTLLGKDGVPILETDQTNKGIDVTE